MKFLVVLPSTQRGGAEDYTLTIASAAVNQGWDVHGAFPQTDETASLIRDFTEKNVHYHRLEISDAGSHSLEALTKPFLRVARTISLLLKIRPDVVLMTLPWPIHCFSSIVACGLLKIPTAVVFQLIPFRFAFSNKKLKAYAWARARNQQWIAISDHNRKFVCESFQMPQDEVLCIYNGIKVKSASSNDTHEDITTLRRQVREELGVAETSKLALTVGRLNSQKGHNDLVQVIPHLIKDFPDVKFVWVGDGELRDDLIQKVQEYGIEDKVRFLGYRSDVPRLLKTADLFVFPTHYEGQPFALLEAMAQGLPIVSSDASGIPELIENRVHGLLFRTGDSCHLSETLRWALMHSGSMQEMGRNAQQHVQDFSEEIMIEETLGVLQGLADLKK
jgi:glycosyltransferase involved in cell wall biosynthesis